MRGVNRAGRIAACIALSSALSACRNRDVPTIAISLSPSAEHTFDLVPESAFVEVLEVPGVKSELRLILSSYPTRCDTLRLPEADHVLLTVTIVLPAGDAPTTRGYPWTGEIALERPTRAVAVPTVRRGNESHVLPAGGEVVLRKLELTPGGTVEGLLAFEFAGDAERAAAHMRGRFRATTCQLARGRQR